jgi:hypothetical protein
MFAALDPTSGTLLDLLKSGGIVAYTLIILWTGYKGKWLWGKEHERQMRIWIDLFNQMRDEKNAWRTIALEASGVAGTALDNLRQSLGESYKPEG